MKKIAFFCIPAHGHTNPMLPVASELVKRGNTVRFYSFDEFANKIKTTGADFVSCNAFLSELTEKEEAGLKNVSTTEMTIQDSKPSIQFRIAYWSFKTFLSIFIPTARLRQPGKFSGGVSYSFVLLMQP
jgi:UDP:flavonoid glycosyltransferase YjiC (YdhE family)